MTDDLLNTIVSHGVLLARPNPDSDQWTGTCPFGDHPELVDLRARSRELAFQLDSPMHPAWRFVAPAWRPAFNVRPATGTWHCFGCGAAGGRDEFVRLIEENR